MAKTTITINAVSHERFEQGVKGLRDLANSHANIIEQINVNGTKVDPASKVVNIVVPTKVSDISNDSNFQTGAQVDAAIAASISQVYKPAGDIAPNALVAGLLIAANLGKVYNLTADATTTSDWKEGAGKTIVAGTDVAIVEIDVYSATADTTAQEGKIYYADAAGAALAEQPTAGSDISSEGYYEKSSAYKFNALAGHINVADFLTNADIVINDVSQQDVANWIAGVESSGSGTE